MASLGMFLAIMPTHLRDSSVVMWDDFHPLPITASVNSKVASSAILTEGVQQYCVRCHNDQALRGNLSLEAFEVGEVADQAETGEKMINKLRAGMMPPPGARRPSSDTLLALVETLEEIIDE